MADLRINTGTRIPFHLCLGILYVTHFLKKYSQEILKGICFILYKNVCKWKTAQNLTHQGKLKLSLYWKIKRTLLLLLNIYIHFGMKLTHLNCVIIYSHVQYTLWLSMLMKGKKGCKVPVHILGKWRYSLLIATNGIKWGAWSASCSSCFASPVRALCTH